MEVRTYGRNTVLVRDYRLSKTPCPFTKWRRHRTIGKDTSSRELSVFPLGNFWFLERLGPFLCDQCARLDIFLEMGVHRSFSAACNRRGGRGEHLRRDARKEEEESEWK